MAEGSYENTQVKACCREQRNLYIEAVGRLQIYEVYCRDQAVHLTQLWSRVEEYRMAYEFQCLQNQYLLQAIDEKHQALIAEKQQVADLRSRVMAMMKCQNAVKAGASTGLEGLSELIRGPAEGSISSVNANTTKIGSSINNAPAMVQAASESLESTSYNDDDVDIDVVNISPPLVLRKTNTCLDPQMTMARDQETRNHTSKTDAAAVSSNYTLPIAVSREHHLVANVATQRTIEVGSMVSSGCSVLKQMKYSKEQEEMSSTPTDLSSIGWKPFDFTSIDPVPKGPASPSGYAVVKVDMVRGKTTSQQGHKRKNYCNFVAKIKEEAVVQGRKVYSVCYMKRRSSYLKDEESTCFVADNSNGDYLCLEEDVVVYLPEPFEDRRGKIHFNKGVSFQRFSLHQ